MRFLPFEEHHTDLLLEWLAQPHVAEFWQEEGTRDEIWKKYRDLPDRQVFPYVIEYRGTDTGQQPKAIGYIQYYDACAVGGGWWPDETPGTFGVDLLIGDPELTGVGLGPKIIRAFMDDVTAREPKLTNFIIDPEPQNIRAIRAYEKVGFEIEKHMTTPNGAAVLMRFRVDAD